MKIILKGRQAMYIIKNHVQLATTLIICHRVYILIQDTHEKCVDKPMSSYNNKTAQNGEFCERERVSHERHLDVWKISQSQTET